MPPPRLALWLAFASLAIARPVFAAPTSDPELRIVKDMVRDAVVAEKAGKCKDSLALLRQAAAIRETGELLLHVGECQAKDNALTEALKSWQSALEVSNREHDAATLAVLGPKIDALRERIPTIVLHLPKGVAGPIVVKVDDRPQEKASAPIAVNPGEHTISVTAEGRTQFTKRLVLVEKDAAVVQVVLPVIGALPEPEQPVAPPPPPRTGLAAVPLPTWIGGGAAVALLGGGIVTFVAAGSAASSGEAACAKMVTCSASDKNKVHVLDALSLGMWVGAGAGAGFAVTWWATHRPPKAEAAPPATGFSPELVIGPTGAWVRGTF